MRHWIRRGLTFVAITAVTAVAALYWLYGGDLGAAVQPVLADWNADGLARDAGLLPAAPAPAEPTPSTP